MYKLILVRHGESVWNKENRFTGWTDVDLSERGEQEARRAGELIKKHALFFDVAYSSVLKRAIRTQHILAEVVDRVWVPEVHHWRLNERHYGALQGLNKAGTVKKYGEEQVHVWRRSFDVTPPLLEPDDSRCAIFEDKYREVDPAVLPLGESLALTITRVFSCWHDYLDLSFLLAKPFFVIAHGNSLRALIKYLDDISDEEIVKLEIPTGIPQLYELDEQLHPLSREYLE